MLGTTCTSACLCTDMYMICIGPQSVGCRPPNVSPYVLWVRSSSSWEHAPRERRRGETSLQDVCVHDLYGSSVTNRLPSSYRENVSDTDSSELSGRSGPAVYIERRAAAFLAPSSGGTYSTGNGATGIGRPVGGESPAAYVIQYDIRTVPVMVLMASARRARQSVRGQWRT